MQQSPRRLLVLGLVGAAMIAFIFFAKTAQADDASKLQGKAAPDVKADLVDGGKLNLAEHKDKHVVILDFWATWCGPCVKGLPIVTQVAKDHADKDVVFFAVNEQEEPADITAFLKAHQLDIHVALDRDGNVGKAFAVEGIPQTVIIGKDGVIKVVHVGITEDFKAELTKDLEKVLANGH